MKLYLNHDYLNYSANLKTLKMFRLTIIQAILSLTFFITSSHASRKNDAEYLLPMNFKDLIHNFNQYHENFPHGNNTNYGKVATSYFTNLNLFKFVENLILNLDYDKLDGNVSSECLNQVKYFGENLKTRQTWTFRVIDSFGKLPSGIMNGNLAWLGDFDECRNITHENFTGQYALLVKSMSVNDIFRPSLLSFKYGICTPDKCSREDIAKMINFVIEILDITVLKELFDHHLNPIDETNVVIQKRPDLDTPAIFTLTFIGVIMLVVLLSTLFDVYKRLRHYLIGEQMRENSRILLTNADQAIDTNLDHDLGVEEEVLYFNFIKNECLIVRLLVSFSAYSNTKKIFKITKENNEFRCLHGIRVLSLCWVILGHSYAFILSFSDNITIFLDWVQRFSFLIVSNAFFSVDTFFLLSGFLTTYVFFKELRNHKLSFSFMIKYYLHRLWRLSPPYFISMLISMNLSAYFGTGPLYPSETGFEINKCRNTWYWNILYINNIIDPDHMCFAISWYLANDMQFHFIAPLVLIPLAFKKAKLAVLIMLLLLIGNSITIPVILSQNDGMETAQFGQYFIDFFQHLYIVPWCRIAPYLFGMFTGYLITIYNNNQSQLNLTKLLNLMCWFISILITVVVVFGLYPDISGNPISRSGHIIYQTFSRVGWSLALSYIIFACITSHGGIVNRILSWPIWVPLSRLTYSTFLVHCMFIIYSYASSSHLYHVQDLGMVI